MIVAAYARTMAGAARIAAQRAIQAPKPVEAVILPFKRHRRVYEPINVPSAYEVAKARHMAFLASLQIRTQTPPSAIIEKVAAMHGVSVADILGQSRFRNVVEARFDAVIAVYHNCRHKGRRFGWSALGRIFNRDHTVIIHAMRRRGVI